MSLGPWQLIIIALVILVLFGRGRISEMMGDFGKGIKSFKKGMTEEEQASEVSSSQLMGSVNQAKKSSEKVRDTKPSDPVETER